MTTTLDTAKLARLVSAYAPHDGSFDLRISGLMVSRLSRINKECVHTLRLSSLCIVAQGAKSVIVGDEVYEYNASQMIVFSLALPVMAQVTQATPSNPYLSLRLELDRTKSPTWCLRYIRVACPRCKRKTPSTSLRPTLASLTPQSA